MSSKANCSNCKFNPHGHSCQRYPKTIIRTRSGDLIYRWAPVNAVEWCGEYQPNQEIEKKNCSSRSFY